jgi:CopG family transcriptional regulator, nickel-responsive regulator
MSTSIISISLPTELLQEIDRALGEQDSSTRSKMFRQAAQSYLNEYKKLEGLKGNIIATISVLYEKHEQNEESFKLQHEYSDMIAAYVHSHLNDSSCLELMVIKGSSKRLKSLIDGLRANKPVKLIKFSIMAVDKFK